jgi:hypothetical protein
MPLPNDRTIRIVLAIAAAVSLLAIQAGHLVQATQAQEQQQEQGRYQLTALSMTASSSGGELSNGALKAGMEIRFSKTSEMQNARGLKFTMGSLPAVLKLRSLQQTQSPVVQGQA